MRHAEHVRVDGQRRLAEGDIEHDIGGLAADARQRLQRLALARHLAAVLGDQLLRQRDDVLGLVAVEADGLDALLHVLHAQRRHLPRRVGDLEQGPRRLVDAGVGRLRREHHRHQQREGVDVLELALGIGVGCGKAREDLRDALRRGLGALPGARALDLGGEGPGRTAFGIGASRAPMALVGLQS